MPLQACPYRLTTELIGWTGTRFSSSLVGGAKKIHEHYSPRVWAQ